MTERAALWHDHSSEHHVAISPTNTQPLSSSPAKATGSPQQPRPEVVPLAANDASASPFAVAAGGYLSASASSTTRRNQLLLLQQALFPLTHSPRSDAASTEHDLRPHAEPKAKQLYETLVGRLLQQPRVCRVFAPWCPCAKCFSLGACGKHTHVLFSTVLALRCMCTSSDKGVLQQDGCT